MIKKSLAIASWNKVEASASVLGFSGKESERKSAFLAGIKGGVILDKTHRLGLNYNPAFNSYATVHNILASYDFLNPVDDSSRFYAGAHAGFSSFRGKNKLYDGYLGNINASGFAYGVQAGYIYDFTKNVEFEIGLNYTKYNVDKKYSASALGHNAKLKLEMKNSISTLVGFNYKF